MPSSHSSYSSSSHVLPSNLDIINTARLPTRPRHQRISSTAAHPTRLHNSSSSPHKASPALSTTASSPTFILPGKRGKVTRLVLVAFILFPPVAIFFLAMLPLILLVTVVFTYSIAWLLYWTMAAPIRFLDLPLDPRRVLKLNRVVFSVILSNLSLIPIGFSLARYRYWTMRGSQEHITDIHYNPKRPLNKLDVYIPKGAVARVMDSNLHTEDYRDTTMLKPVVVFIYGGAWSSGSKLLYTLVGAQLQAMGYLAIVPEYSIYPQGTILDMEQDVKMAVRWAHSNCRDFGGDPQQLYLMGHSAGAHLCAVTVLNDSIRRIPVSLLGTSSAAISTSPILSTILSDRLDSKCKQQHQQENDVLPRLRGMILCSGVYDISEHYKHESMRGVEQISAMGRVMGNSEATFRLNSPNNILQELLQVSTRIDRTYPTESQTRHQNLLRHLKSLLPMETLVIHGDMDTTVPVRSSAEFFMELKTLQLGSGARLRIIQGMGHEEPVVALMPCFGRKAPFRQPLIDEISQFICSDKGLSRARRESRRN